MIIFNNDEYLNEIKVNGITSSDACAISKINYYVSDILMNTAYPDDKIVKKVETVASEFMQSLPDAKGTIKGIIGKMRKNIATGKVCHEDKTITLYYSEMQKIAELKNENLRKLALAGLIAFKHQAQHTDDGTIKYHTKTKVLKSDIYKLSGLKLSGTKKNELWYQLCDLGYFDIGICKNSKYTFNKSWIAFQTIAVPFAVEKNGNCESEKKFIEVSHYNDIWLYWLYYMGDSNIRLCQSCGSPYIKTGNANRICNKCKKIRKENRAIKNHVAITA